MRSLGLGFKLICAMITITRSENFIKHLYNSAFPKHAQHEMHIRFYNINILGIVDRASHND